MDCVPKNRSEGNQIQRKNKNTSIKHESRLIFSAATGRVDEKIIPRWPIKTKKLQLSGRESRCLCLPPPSACNGLNSLGSALGGADKHLSQNQFFLCNYTGREKNSRSLDPGKRNICRTGGGDFRWI